MKDYKKVPSSGNTILKFTQVPRNLLRNKNFLIFILFFIFFNVSYYFYTGNHLLTFHCEDSIKITRKILNPPKVADDDDKRQLLEKHYELLKLGNDTLENKLSLSIDLSSIVQNQIKVIQHGTEMLPVNCSAPNLLCGHHDDCGFGCQLHHRVACVMISYALNLPLIHDQNDGWYFTKKWDDLFQPLGTNCVPGPNTFFWSWPNNAIFRGSPCLLQPETSDTIEYPLKDGIVVNGELGSLVDKVADNKFLWWAGQFMKYALRPTDAMDVRLRNEMESIGFKHPIFGIHVRRTDKAKQSPEAFHELEEYFNVGDEFFNNLTQFSNYSGIKRAFIASEDSKVYWEAQEKFPDWEILGFPFETTLWSAKARADTLNEIVRDIWILSQCDFVVCGFESNVCRLMLPFLVSKHLDGEERLRSLDFQYIYMLHYHGMPNNVFKVNQSLTLLIEDIS